MAVQPLTPPSPTRSHYWPPPQGQWTYEDYLRLPDNGFRYEVIEGEIYMSPAPRPNHQKVLGALHGFLWSYLQNKPIGELFFAPIDVILGELGTPVQPDLLYLRSERVHLVTEKLIDGSPDMVVEIISPTSETYDRHTKFKLYAQAGILEYWLIDPLNCQVEIFVLRGKAYIPLGPFQDDDSIRSELFPDLGLTVAMICG